MAPILRYQPGDIAPWSGNYELVGHYGERIGRVEWRDEGARVPPVRADDPTGLMWWVFLDERAAKSVAA